MSNFWDSIIGEPVVEAVIEPIGTSNFWASLGVESKPVEKAPIKVVKQTTKKSKAVAQAEKVYETVEGLVVPAEDCIHYWTIPAETAWAIGVCQNCNGEMWFSNRYTTESVFNDTLVPPKIDEQEITDIIDTDADIRDIVAAVENEVTTYREIEDGA